MSNTIQLDDAKLPPAMAAYGRRERVAEIIYNWIHENQVTHRRTWAERTEEDRALYRRVAESIDVIYTACASERAPAPAAAPSDTARLAAEEIREWIGISGLVDGEGINEVAAIISKHLPTTPADSDASLTRAALAFANGEELSATELETLKECLARALRELK